MPKAPERNGTDYGGKDVPPKIVSILEAARLAHLNGRGYRLRIVYGDTATGKPWGDHHSERPCGYIGRSCGPQLKVPLLLPLRTSMGGEPISLHRIVKIEHANKQNGGVLYDVTPNTASSGGAREEQKCS